MSTELTRAVFGDSSEESDWEDEVVPPIEKRQQSPSPKKASTKKRKAPAKGSAAKKKRKSGHDNAENDDDDDKDEADKDEEVDLPKSNFEQTIINMKNDERAYRKAMNNTEVTAETDEKVEAFIKRMDDAMHADRDSMKNNRPALKVLNMLDLTFKTLSKRHLQESFVSQGVLSVLANWLQPYDNGILPHSSIRALVLKICDHFSIDSGQLKDSGLGIIVAKLKKDKKELKSNRRLAHELINKWCRQIFPTATADYADYPAEERYLDALERKRQLKDRGIRTETTEKSRDDAGSGFSGAIADSGRSATPKKGKKDREAMLSKRARVPQANLTTYAMPPPPEDAVEQRLQHPPSLMSSGDRKIKQVRESRGKASKARVTGMKIVGV